MRVINNEISYEYYFNVYNSGHQGVLPQQEFDRYIKTAQREVDGYLCCDDAADNDVWSAVISCVCEVADALFKDEKQASVKSESTDGYAVTFKDTEDVDDKVRKIILRRLGRTGLLYAGVE